MAYREIKIVSATDSDGRWNTSTMHKGYGPDPTASMTGLVEDLVRALIASAPGNRIEVTVNGNKVEIGGEQTAEWLRKIIG